MKILCKSSLLAYLFLIFTLTGIAQQDSLKSILNLPKHDTIKCRILNAFIEEEGDEEIWKVYNDSLKRLCEKNLKQPQSNELKRKYLIYLAGAINNIGISEDMNGDFKNALKHYEKSLKIRTLIQDSSGIASSLQNIGTLYALQGNSIIALDYYEKSLAILTKTKDKKAIAACFHNIATIYDDYSENTKAEEYFLKSLKIEEEIGNKSGIATTLNSIANIYRTSKDYTKSFEYYTKSLELAQKIDDPVTEASAYDGMSKVYYEKKDFEKAMFYGIKCLELSEKNNDVFKISSSLNTIGLVFLTKKNYKKAFEYCSKSLSIAQKSKYYSNIKNSALNLKNIYLALHQPEKAVSMLELYISTHELMAIEETKKASVRSEIKYEYELKATEEKRKVDEEKRLSLIKLKQEKTQRYFLYGFLLLILVFLAFVMNRFRITRKQKEIIEEQKHVVEEKQKEIIDSITYAKRLQEAILPSQDFVNSYIERNFILYKPKDVVAGDFYWAETITEKNNSLFFIAAADSTGHGVPGAMVSVVCSNALNRSVKEFKLTSTNEILNKTRELVIQTFEKSSSDVKDGMDISLLCIDKQNRKITWSGANNSLIYISNNELHEIKADKQPIGKSEYPKPFSIHEIEYKENTMLYLFTDGYADQFGGPKGKKFKHNPLNELLQSLQFEEMRIQKNKLDLAFENWKGNLEQVDDVCIIGIKI